MNNIDNNVMIKLNIDWGGFEYPIPKLNLNYCFYIS